ncbi:hypothetical protein BGP_6525 [Beggiatoa sp. PS]|nr:hypothetical protein BGP_6525 [Beggiatoa sp. PS]
MERQRIQLEREKVRQPEETKKRELAQKIA